MTDEPTNEFTEALLHLAGRVRSRAEDDPRFREDLRALARFLLAAAEAPQAPSGRLVVSPSREAPAPEAPAVAAGPVPAGPNGAVPAAVAPPPVIPRPAAPVAPRLVPAVRDPIQAPAPPPASRAPEASEFVRYGGWPEVTDEELPLIARRCRLKAEGARWAATRRRKLGAGADYRTEVEAMDRDIIQRAKGLPDCYLWMCHPSFLPPASDLPRLDDLAACFDNLAAAVDVSRGLLGGAESNREPFEQSLDLMAEAQSALRIAVDEVGGGTDKDQQRAYLWLKTTGSRDQIYIRRFMRLDDPADPLDGPGLAGRIGALDSRLQETHNRVRRRQAALNKVKYHLGRIPSDGAGVGGTDEHRHDWEKIIAAVDEMVRDGVAPSSRDLRDLLLPAIDALPDFENLPAGFALVLREIDRFQSAEAGGPEAACAEQATAEVKQAAELLRGRSVVLIGGERRPHAHQSLKNALGLKELDWVNTREHGSVTVFEPHIARPDVAVVLLAIRWSSHAYGDVKIYCDRHGKSLVRLPAGYNPNQVAAQILNQCGERLRKGE